MNSRLPFEVIAAVRFLREGFIQTILIVVGVAVGVSVIVFMSALLDGVQDNFMNRVLSTQAEITILPQKDVSRALIADGPEKVVRTMQSRPQRHIAIDQWRKLRDILSARPAVDIVSPMATGSVILVRGSATRTVTLQGIDPEQYYRLVNIPDDMVAGTARITGQDVLIGKDLADDIGMKVGDKVLLRSASGISRTLDLAGIFDLGNKGFNQRIMIGTLNTAQGLLGMAGNVSTIDLSLKDPYAANEVADSIAVLHHVEADSWIRTNAQFFTAISSQNVSSTAIRVSVALSVALGIASVLVVSVVQRSREIGILRAMGASQGQIMRIFLVQGGIVGLMGSIAGSILARGILVLWMLYARNADGTPFFPVSMPLSLYGLATILATVCGVMAAVMPALRASKLDPVVAIRG